MKPTIYLGLGGTGNLAISVAKKLYEEECGVGQIPESVAFVTVDFQTDMDNDPGLATDISHNFIKIEMATNPKEFYRVRRENHGQYAWMFDGNSNNIDNRISKGAKAVRTTGRLYTEMVLETVMARLASVYGQVVNVDAGAEMTAGVNIHMVMSIAGGTGAGSFITIANAIKKKWGNEVNLYGYGVTHSVFRAMDVSGIKTPNVELNAISALIDLDYLQTASDSNPIEIELGGKKTKLTEPAFDGFYVIDNTSDKGYMLKTVNSLCEVIGTCLYACGAEAGDKVENIVNNVGPKEGKNHVGAKLGWVQGLGACQVVYKGDLVARTYSLKAALELIRTMRNEGSNVHQQALAWTEEFGIREDGDEYNMLIDGIYSPKQLQSLRMPLIDQANTEAANRDAVNKYLVNLVDFPTEEIIKDRIETLKDEILKKVQGYLADANGVGSSIRFLNSLLSFCNKYKGEMTEEARMISAEKDEKMTSFLDRVFREYDDRKYGKLRIGASTKNQELLDDIVGRPAKTILQLSHDAKRREVARDIYVSLIAYVETLIQQLKDKDNSLGQLVARYEEELVALQAAAPDSKVFEYDLSYQDRITIEIEPNELSISDYVKGLENGFLAVSDTEELSKSILAYTMNLDRAKGYLNRLITDVVDNLPDEEYKKLKDQIDKKSARWLKVNDRGQVVNSTGMAVGDAVVKNWILTMYKPSANYKSRLHQDAGFMPNVTDKQFVYVDKDSAKQKMIFCRIDGSLIPYCIDVINEGAMERYENAVRKCMAGEAVYNPHFDRLLFEKMKSEDFKLKPEMKNEAIFYWVAGHFFGWDNVKEEERIMGLDEKGDITVEEGKEIVEHIKYIRCLRKKYMYWDEKAMDGKDKKWIPFGGAGTSRRDTAYNSFKTEVLPELKEEFKKVILQQFNARREWWRGEITRVIEAGLADYINRVICSDKNSQTYMASHGGEYTLIQQEFSYLCKDFWNALSNLK